jgi:hypothetical protein
MIILGLLAFVQTLCCPLKLLPFRGTDHSDLYELLEHFPHASDILPTIMNTRRSICRGFVDQISQRDPVGFDSI